MVWVSLIRLKIPEKPEGLKHVPVVCAEISIFLLDFFVHFIYYFCAYEKDKTMRTTVTIEKEAIDELMDATKARSKASAVREAVSEYLRRRKIDKIKSLKGKLEFESGTAEDRHRER